MKRLTLFLIAVFAFSVINKTAAQQGALTGKVLDDKGAPAAYANITLLKAKDSAFAANIISDSTGQFSLVTPAAGRYFIRLRAIGYKETKTDVFEVATESFSKDFGTIILDSIATNLSNVTITSLRPTIVQLADRMVVTVEGTAMAACSNAYTVLSKAPGVFID